MLRNGGWSSSTAKSTVGHVSSATKPTTIDGGLLSPQRAVSTKPGVLDVFYEGSVKSDLPSCLARFRSSSIK